MSTATKHFGPGVDTSTFTPFLPSSTGQPRCCIGYDRHMPNIRWYGVMLKSNSGSFVRYNPDEISFCQYCGENGFKASEVFEIQAEEYPGLKANLVCDAASTKKYIDIVGNRRCVLRPFTLPNGRTARMQVNINLTDEKDIKWCPVLKGASLEDDEATAAGTLRAKIPTHTYWKFVVQAYIKDLDDLPDDLWFKIESAKFKDGREVLVTNQHGNTNIVTPLVRSLRGGRSAGQIIVKSYKTGISGQNFFFVAPATQEKDAGLAVEHDCSSNILELVITICRTKPKPVYRCIQRQTHIQMVTEKDVTSKGDVGLSKGGVGRSKSGGVMRGISKGGVGRSKSGGVMLGISKGGVGRSKGVGSLTGGSNFGASGFSDNIKTNRTIETELVDRVACTIQLVNDETNSERLRFATMVEDQTQSWRDVEIERLAREQEELKRGSGRSRGMADVLKNQSSHLV